MQYIGMKRVPGAAKHGAEGSRSYEAFIASSVLVRSVAIVYEPLTEAEREEIENMRMEEEE